MNTTQNTPNRRSTNAEETDPTVGDLARGASVAEHMDDDDGSAATERDNRCLAAFDEIVTVLNGAEWEASTLETIADLVRGAGVEIDDHEPPYVQTCERAECGNEMVFEDIVAGDGLCGSCAEGEDTAR